MKKRRVITPAYRDKLAENIHAFREAGDTRRLAHGLLQLGSIYFHTGTKSGTGAGDSAASCIFEAIPLLRELGDQKELAQALRAPAIQWYVPNEQRAAMLKESEEISFAIGDWSSVGWAILNRGLPDQRSIKRAQSYFRKANDHYGLSVSYAKSAGSRWPDPYLHDQAVFYGIYAREYKYVAQRVHVANLFLRNQLTASEVARKRILAYRLEKLSQDGKKGLPLRKWLSHEQKREARKKQEPMRLRAKIRNRNRKSVRPLRPYRRRKAR